MPRELTWHERRAINLRLQRRDGQLQRARSNPSTGVAAGVAAARSAATTVEAPVQVAEDTSPAPLDDFPQPLQGFDYAFGAVG